LPGAGEVDTGEEEVFTATVSDPDGDVRRVWFTIGDSVWCDSSSTDGWSQKVDMGRLPVGTLPMKVRASDADGLVSETYTGSVVVKEPPFLAQRDDDPGLRAEEDS